MGWQPGQPVDLTIERGSIVVARSGGADRLTTRGHLRLPLRLRRRCGITAGSRVLVIADEPHGEVIVVPASVLEDMLSCYRSAGPFEGGRR